MSHDFIQNAVNNLYRDNELMALKGELANLKAERDQLKSDLEKSDGVVWTLSVENDRLKAEVERLIKTGQWQPIDTAPRYQDVLCWLYNYQSIVVGCEVSSCHWEDTSSNSTIYPTHWMPLPSAPAKEEQS